MLINKGANFVASGKRLTRHVVPHNTNLAEEPDLWTLVEGRGLRVTDSTGRTYLDLAAGGTRANAVGWGREEIAEAMYDQAKKLHYFTPADSHNAAAVKFAAILSELMPGDLSMAFFVCDGSEAVETAFKLAKQYNYYRGLPRKYKIISRRDAYHGTTMGALSAMGANHPLRRVMDPLVPGYLFVERPYCYRCPYGKDYPNCDIDCAQALEKLILDEGPEQVAAFIAEPIMQMGGCVIPPPEYFPMIREICEKHDVLLIDDEVITGFGRTGKMFGIEHFGVVPDIMVMAKQLTSGYVPMGAAVTKPSVIGEFPVFRHIHTYGGHPVACRAAAVNLEIIKREGLVENAREMGEYFLDGLKELERHPIVGEVRGIGLWLGIEFVQDKKTKARFPEDNNPALRIVKRIREKGAFCRPSMQSIEIAPALIITRSDIDEAVKIIEEAIVEEVQFLGM